MTDIVRFALLSLAFAAGNVLDGYTTYLCLFKLPAGRVSSEMNPIAASGITEHFTRQMWWKGLGVGFIILVLLTLNAARAEFMLYALNVLMGFVVANNLYVYLGRLKKQTLSPGQHIQKLFNVPSAIAFFILVGVFFGAALLVAWGIAGKWRL